MELSPEDRERIYLEEKTRLEARRTLRKPVKHVALILVTSVAALVFIVWLIGSFRNFLTTEALRDTETRSAFEAVNEELRGNANVYKIGGLQSVERTDKGWRFLIQADYKDADTGLIVHQTLIAYADRDYPGWIVRLRKPQ